MTRYSTYYEGDSFGFGGRMTRAVKYIIIICVVSFLAGKLIQAAGSALWIRGLGLTPLMVREYFTVWQFVTYMFLHGGLWHLLFNMFALWMFGTEVERAWGSREFTVFFLFTGTVVGILFFIFASGLPLIISAGSPGNVLIGSSGAIFAILAAYGMMFPERTILFMFIFPIRAKYFVLIIAAIELYLIWTPSGISNFAHLSGMLIGYLYLKKDWNFSSLLQRYYDRKRRRRIRLVEDEERRQKEQSDEVDRILDKISRKGMESLTRRERKILERASSRKKD